MDDLLDFYSSAYLFSWLVFSKVGGCDLGTWLSVYKGEVSSCKGETSSPYKGEDSPELKEVWDKISERKSSTDDAY